GWLAAVHPRHQVPHRAEVIVGAGVIALVALLDVGDAIGFSSFTVLTYYAVTNASALTLAARERRWPRALAALGLAGCLVVAASLPGATAVRGVVVLACGLVLFAITRVRRRTRA